MKVKTNGHVRGDSHITKEQYERLDRAYTVFNEQLFEGSLTPVMITLQPKAGRFGKYVPDGFSKRGDSSKTTAQLMLNPDHFGKNDEQVLLLLAIQMVPHWQAEYGTPSRKGYYNQELRDKMKSIGLPTSGSGQKVGIEIEPGGRFQNTARVLIGSGWSFDLQSPEEQAKEKKEKPPSKVKYSCRQCELNAWAKPEVVLGCWECGLEMLMPEVDRDPRSWESNNGQPKSKAPDGAIEKSVSAPPTLVHMLYAGDEDDDDDPGSAVCEADDLTDEELDCGTDREEEVTCPECCEVLASWRAQRERAKLIKAAQEKVLKSTKTKKPKTRSKKR